MKEREFQFEGEWSSAFSQVELAPSERVWNGIEAELNRKESGRLKRNFLIWQLAAAVSLVMAAGVLINNYFWSSEIESTPVVSNLEVETESPIASEKSDPEIKSSPAEETTTLATVDKASDKEDANLSLHQQSTTPLIAEAKEESHWNSNELTGSFNSLNKIGSVQMPKVWLPTPDVHKVRLPLRVEEESVADASSYPVWAGVNVAGGASSSGEMGIAGFGAFRQENGVALDGQNQNQTVRNSSKTGFGYAVGFAVGKGLGKRVYIQSGLQYIVQSTQVTTNAYYLDMMNQSEEPITTFNYGKPLVSESGSTIRQIEFFSSPQTFNSSLEYFSIPVQLGYLIIDRKLDWGITAGLSSDFFIRNVITDKSGDIEGFVTRNKDQDSPFRPVNFSAILSTEVNYNFTDNYSISLEPRYSIGINPVTREKEDVEEERLRSVSVGVKLRYIF